ncbi:hypothetical protein [Bradyrhizobium arachidis]|uniref:Uncharacterized protein n=1 Tax=Bradyrhizobium arachidis TaxID=858423 RepID=A0AAE7NPS1_9BRAD|nr:hypothetical protein [Bradyrhizobium arachidis]QOZ68852.1 hypothetical protein WN72_22895 [Bradyrhizobium arachidis]SFV19277.1 hypothetical protein SAMN05192541_14825 [Bradyrhizobium arachidis]
MSSPVPPSPLSLEERQALNWFRLNAPAEADGGPEGYVRVALVRRGLVGTPPARRRFDPIRYVITERGREVIKHG